MMQKVLIIDDNPAIGSALKILLNLHDIASVFCLTPQAGLQQLSEDSSIALVIQDMNFSEDTTSGDEGITLFHAIRDLHTDIPIILLTAWTQLETAVELVKDGAADYIAKPWNDNKLVTTITNLLELSELQQQQLFQVQKQQQAKEKLTKTANLCGIVYQSAIMQYLIELAVKVAPSNLPVLITGPNGSGKEKIAQIIQANSLVKNGPFIRVNVGALSNELIEAELFGAEAGAYTGITKMRIGRFEAADGGTLFLDELGTLSASGQAKLLRVLQTGEFERLGSSKTQKCHVRVISATNTDLKKAIENGLFREDLFYRVNVIELKLPALNQRPEDIPMLIQEFLQSASESKKNPKRNSRNQYTLNLETLNTLQAYPWPGNVRELENACQRALLLSQRGEIQLEHFGLSIDKNAKLTQHLNIEPTEEMIESALANNHGIIAQAARQLGLSRQALYRRIEKYKLHKNDIY